MHATTAASMIIAMSTTPPTPAIGMIPKPPSTAVVTGVVESVPNVVSLHSLLMLSMNQLLLDN